MAKITLKRKIDKVCSSLDSARCVDMPELERTLNEMKNEALIIDNGDNVRLTEQGQSLGKEWRSLLLKKEPILEVVAGSG
jgi:predicted transcriptional regulator